MEHEAHEPEIVQDFRENLKDLTTATRAEIATLTVVAQENVEHAAAISRVIIHHIETAPSTRKIPAFYLLDSIVKNVRPTYATYVQPALFKTFMSAYSQVDGKARQAMENMLKTWKEPVPGATDRKPVFPVEATRVIENALMQARSAYQQQIQATQHPRQAHALPARPPIYGVADQSWGRPTPPPQGGQYGPPPFGSHHSPTPPANGYMLRQQFLPPAQQYVSDYPSQTSPTPPHYIQPAFVPPHHEYQQLMSDLDRLIGELKHHLGANLHDSDLQVKTSSMLQLQSALQGQMQLQPDTWAAIKNEVFSLLQTYRHGPPAQGPAPYQQTPTPQQYAHPYPAPQPFQAPPSASTHPSLDPNVLAALSAALGPPRQGTPQTSPVPDQSLPRSAAPAIGTTQTMPGLDSSSASIPIAGGMKQDPAFLEQLNALSGVLGMKQVNPAAGSATSQQLAVSTATGLSGLSALLRPGHDVQLSAASLRTPRPELMRTLWAQRTQCRTCGRRFATTAEGKARKARHLDYHFRTNMRLADNKSTIATRSWYVNEMEWIRFREVDDADASNETSQNAAKGGDVSGQNGDEQQAAARPYVRAPSDASKANRTCPICQDSFDNTWHDGAQEWVWMDCVKGADGRYFHHSCREEVQKDEAAAKDREDRARERETRDREAKAKAAQLKQSKPQPKAPEGPAEPAPEAPLGLKSPHRPDSVLGKRKQIVDDEDDYEPTEERRVSAKVEAQA